MGVHQNEPLVPDGVTHFLSLPVFMEKTMQKDGGFDKR